MCDLKMDLVCVTQMTVFKTKIILTDNDTCKALLQATEKRLRKGVTKFLDRV